MRLQKQIKRALCISLSAMVVLSGCSKESPDTKPNNTAETVSEEANQVISDTEDTEVMLASLRDKYGAVDSEYAEDIIYVDRAESIQIPISFDPYAKEDFSWEDHFKLYQDAQRQYEFSRYCFYEYDDEQKILTITPPILGALEMKSYYGSEISLDDLSGEYLSDDITNDNWGNLSQMYLVEDIDSLTGDTLEKPLINIIKVNTEIKTAPKVTYSCNEAGNAYISWNAVEGAKEYLLFSVVKTQDEGFDSYTKTFGRTTETSWTSSDGADGERVYMMNDFFRNFITSDDDLYGGSEDMNEDLFETMPEYIGVIAINEDGASAVSELMPLKEYAKMLPNSLAYYNNETGIGDLYRENVADLPAEVAVTMCDGTTTKRVIDYDFEHVEYEEGVFLTMYINGYAQGTQVYQEYMVSLDNSDTLQQDLDALQQRQDALKTKGGTKSTDINIIDEPSSEPAKEETQEPTQEVTQEPTQEETQEPTQEVTQEPTQEPTPIDNLTNSDNKITANSALSEYIAMHLLNSVESIDVSMFTESRNVDVVFDAFLEANYQNPLVLGIEDISFDTETRIVYVQYEDSADVAVTKREEARKKAKEIVAQIINDSMSDIEKEIAINTYLCENAVYDDAALASAEANNFQTVDESFNDSFTPYGVLVKGVGVCASYAGAFKVLADEAGLDAIVVTGNLNGNLPHAWNRVNIDGQWVTIDVTNNDNDQIQNALLNISDRGANGVLVEDDDFAMNDSLSNYTCDNDEKEFYRYNDKYFDVEVIADKLAEELAVNNQAVLRTKYDITDEDFQVIAQSVADKSGADIRGYYWLGVINLSR